MHRGRILAGALGLLLGLLVAAPASASVPGEFFGLGGWNQPGNAAECSGEPNPSQCTQEKWDRLRQVGIRSWRIGIQWQLVQPTESGPYNWNSVNSTVGRAAAAGIRTVPRIYQAPEWATACTDCPPIGPDSEAMGHWKEMVAAAAKRFGRCDGDTEPGFNPLVDCAAESFWKTRPIDEYFPIKWWQVWEEPNFESRWRKPASEEQLEHCDEPNPPPELNCGQLCRYPGSSEVLQCKESAREYAELVRATHEGITGEDGDPTAKILLGGLPEIAAISGTKQTDFLRFIYIKGSKSQPGWETGGIKRYLDGVALHPYSTDKEGVRGSLIRAKDVMKTYGHWNYKGVKISTMLTEFGFASDTRQGCAFGTERPECVPRAEPFVSDPAGERRKLKKTYKMLVNNRDEYHVARAFWFGYHDQVEWGDCPDLPCPGFLGNGWTAYTGLFFSEDCALDNTPVPPSTPEESHPECIENYHEDDHPHGSRAKPAWCGYIQTTNAYLLNPDVTVPLADCAAPPPSP